MCGLASKVHGGCHRAVNLGQSNLRLGSWRSVSNCRAEGDVTRPSLALRSAQGSKIPAFDNLPFYRESTCIEPQRQPSVYPSSAVRSSITSTASLPSTNRSAWLSNSVFSGVASHLRHHRLSALAIARADQSRNVQRTRPLPSLMTQPLHESYQPACEFVFPPRYGQPSKSQPPLIEKPIRESYRIWQNQRSAEVMLMLRRLCVGWRIQELCRHFPHGRRVPNRPRDNE